MKFLTISVILLLVLSSCGVLITDRKEVENLSKKDSLETIFINSFKKSCVGVGPMSCLLVQKNDALDHNAWENFYNEIDGFDFEPGYIYKLKIRTEALDAKNVPADASSIKYSLVEILDKWVDKRMRINDIWALTAINSDVENLDTFLKSQEHPSIELNVAEMKLYGNNGCNSLEGNIITLDDNRLELSEISSTDKLCPNMDIPSQFLKMLEKTWRYEIENLELILFDNRNKEILRFKKVD